MLPGTTPSGEAISPKYRRAIPWGRRRESARCGRLHVMPLPFHLVNVFSVAGDPFSGNPLCVFPESGGLSDGEMLAWARQFNLSECAFVTSLGGSATAGEASVRIFTPGHEMPFAGH